MKTFRAIFLLTVLMLTVLSLSAFQTAEDEVPLLTNPNIETNEPEDPKLTAVEEQIINTNTEPVTDLNPVTGMPVSNPDLLRLPPVFVPLARYPSAFRPSSGHSQAQWVFEMYVNNEESRPILMFYGEQPTVPVSRISSAIFGLEELRRQYGGIIIAGGTSKSVLDSDIKSLELWYGESGDQLYPELPVERYQRIVNKWEKLSTPADPNNLRYSFNAEAPQGGQTADSFFVRYASTNQILWRYDAASGKYLRMQNSVEDPLSLTADVDTSTGEQIGADNLIILMATHDWAPDQKPEYGLFTVNFNFVASNPALILRDGKLYHVNWTTKSEQFERESMRMRPIRFLDANGNNFMLKPGKTWVHIVMPGNPVYEVNGELGSEITPGSGFWKMPYISFKPGSTEEVMKEVEELKQLEIRLNEAYFQK
ncbi:MAG: DUF3048 C-terminal domain-containing protein [Anaerolineaceae bacterium]|nr:DUF3048 C-terminal domain-containing protein [Anaerolineaceae bacterium]